jgi:hypothetical protein
MVEFVPPQSAELWEGAKIVTGITPTEAAATSPDTPAAAQSHKPKHKATN